MCDTEYVFKKKFYQIFKNVFGFFNYTIISVNDKLKK